MNELVDFRYLGDGRVNYKELDKQLPDAFALIGQMDMPRERLLKAPGLKVIFNVEGNFYQNIDYDYCFEKNIHVLNCGVVYSKPVAEMGLCFALDLARGVTREDRQFRQGKETYLGDSCKDSVLLSGSDVGFIGFGNLGRALLKLLQPFNCRIKIYDPWIPDSVILENNCIPAALDDVLSGSQFIFVLAGVTKDNQGFLNKDKFSLIRPDAFFMLLSRASVVDFDSLTDFVSRGKFSAAVDVFPEEPMTADHPVRSINNMILSPHRAGGIPWAFNLIGEMLMDDLSLLMRGLPPVRMQRALYETVRNLVSKPAG
ncbi:MULTISPECIES: NAD(P)-dependent oxidoreductase [unclassified Oceanispirochaeta]|uniref:NAD(P)-dependent oxidoreductase n=1 Tax=unclassified Oceanispirochaeta TaxID=2635722 RepID=UPI0013150223|nr:MULTISPECIES: NAD(P)-dependent oxidoreductase [unclassified Oceanispirochaeta]MBF9018020.1 hydroxyacid dehydrogenase [Oceanispirochaeta sp. M2]NPD74532.1 hydroxyacid dehydrogenase [Oceanispirochaeta sp. M1]